VAGQTVAPDSGGRTLVSRGLPGDRTGGGQTDRIIDGADDAPSLAEGDERSELGRVKSLCGGESLTLGDPG
jgi:hypothetical protein